MKMLRKKSNSFLLLRRMHFFECLQAAQKLGEIHKNRDCKMLAKYLMCFLEGLIVMGTNYIIKTGPYGGCGNRVFHG